MKSITYKFILIAFLLCLGGKSAIAQFNIQDLEGRPILKKAYTNIEGSPYLHADWGKGMVKLSDGTTYKQIELLYDQVSDELLFKGPDGQMRSFVDTVKEFEIQLPSENAGLTSHIFRRGYTSLNRSADGAFYEVLTDGATQLLKRTTKAILEETTYSSATKIKRFHENVTYYISKNEKLTKIKPDKKAVIAALSDKAPEIEKYLKEKKPDLKKDAELAALVTYYNTL